MVEPYPANQALGGRRIPGTRTWASAAQTDDTSGPFPCLAARRKVLGMALVLRWKRGVRAGSRRRATRAAPLAQKAVAQTLIAFALVALPLACGGGSEDAGHRSQRLETATAEAPPAPAAPQAVGDELREYLDQMGDEQESYEQVRERALATFDGITEGRPDASWVAAASDVRRLSDAYGELAIRMSTISPPAQLKDEHRGMVKSLQLYSQGLDAMAGPLA